MFLGLGWPQWLTIAGLIGGLWLTFWVMAKASAAYERARQRKQQPNEAQQPKEEVKE
ncbi:MAG TPA: hypothetical protein VHJ82_04385 [Actinomycetota bacterium]|nr:hypothetical protein [Actinomycetota bacterium]